MHDLHVLLHDGRLRQPRGFEGLGLRVEVRPPEALPTPRSGDAPDRVVGGNVATCTVTANVQGCDRQFSEIAHFDNLDGEVGKDREQVLPPAADSVVAAIAAFHKTRARDAFDLLVHQCQMGVEVAPVDGVKRLGEPGRRSLATLPAKYPVWCCACLWRSHNGLPAIALPPLTSEWALRGCQSPHPGRSSGIGPHRPSGTNGFSVAFGGVERETAWSSIQGRRASHARGRWFDPSRALSRRCLRKSRRERLAPTVRRLRALSPVRGRTSPTE